MSFQVRPLTPHLGAEIQGVDFTQPLSEKAEKFVLDAWVRYGILLIRNPENNDEAQMRFSKLFGEMEPGAVKFLNNDDNPYLMTLKNDPDDGAPKFRNNPIVNGEELAGWLGWHWDQSFMPTIVRGAVLRMTHPASEKGYTGFIDAIGAYDRLSDEMKERIENLEVVYLFNPDFTSGQFGFPKDIRIDPPTDEQKSQNSSVMGDFHEVVHPLVITQGETGRKVLKLSPMHARYVLGMERAESDALLQELAEHLGDEQFAYWHKWEKNDMMAWDNWRVVHGASGVPPHVKRVAMRTTIAGDYKVGRYLDPKHAEQEERARIVD